MTMSTENKQIMQCERLYHVLHVYGPGSAQRGFNLYHTFPTFNDLNLKKKFGNIVGKGENAGNQHFLIFPLRFLPFPNKFQYLGYNFLLSANALNLD